MANLSYREKTVLEELFGMSSGYVMDFSNNSFSQFVGDVINLDVYNSPGYEAYTSKANKLRQIWNNEPDQLVGMLIEALLFHFEDMQLKHSRLTSRNLFLTDCILFRRKCFERYVMIII